MKRLVTIIENSTQKVWILKEIFENINKSRKKISRTRKSART